MRENLEEALKVLFMSERQVEEKIVEREIREIGDNISEVQADLGQAGPGNI